MKSSYVVNAMAMSIQILYLWNLSGCTAQRSFTLSILRVSEAWSANEFVQATLVDESEPAML